MTSQRPTRPQLSSPRSSSTTTILSLANTSTSSLTLVESYSTTTTTQQAYFPAPPRTDTSTSTNSTSSTSSAENTFPSHASRTRRNQVLSPPSNPSQAAILRARSANQSNRQAKMSARRAELLRYKGTYTDSGRHSDDWLFGGWSFTGTVKGAWKWAHGNGNGNGHGSGAERRE